MHVVTIAHMCTVRTIVITMPAWSVRVGFFHERAPEHVRRYAHVGKRVQCSHVWTMSILCTYVRSAGMLGTWLAYDGDGNG